MLESEILDLINQVRRRKGLTQKEMASLIGISPSAYSKFESAKGNISLDRVIAVLNQLDLELYCTKKGENISKEQSPLLERISEILTENQKLLVKIHQKI